MFQSKLQVLNRVNLEVPLKKVLQLNPSWSPEHLKDAEVAYKHFLYVARLYRGEFPIVPHLSVDQVWHQHILCTKNYVDFCAAFFGNYYHHDPGEGGPPTERHKEGFVMTCNAIVHHFGEVNDPRELLAKYYPDETPHEIRVRDGLD